MTWLTEKIVCQRYTYDPYKALKVLTESAKSVLVQILGTPNRKILKILDMYIRGRHLSQDSYLVNPLQLTGLFIVQLQLRQLQATRSLAEEKYPRLGKYHGIYIRG